jgi:hypothetical protein
MGHRTMQLNIVPPRRGLAWVGAGVRLFARQPLAIGGLFFMFMALVSVLSLAPIIGGVLTLMLLPAGTVTMMAASREVLAGRFPMPVLLFDAVRFGKARSVAMVQLGALYAVAFLAVIAVSALADGGDFARLYLLGDKVALETLEGTRIQVAMLVAMALYAPVSMLFWHSPALVLWHGMSPTKAIFFSTVACLKNTKAYLYFGVGWMVFFTGASVLIGTVAMALGGEALLVYLMMPLALMLASMMFASIYPTFIETFQFEAPPPGDNTGISP